MYTSASVLDCPQIVPNRITTQMNAQSGAVHQAKFQISIEKTRFRYLIKESSTRFFLQLELFQKLVREEIKKNERYILVCSISDQLTKC